MIRDCLMLVDIYWFSSQCEEKWPDAGSQRWNLLGWTEPWWAGTHRSLLIQPEDVRNIPHELWLLVEWTPLSSRTWCFVRYYCFCLLAGYWKSGGWILSNFWEWQSLGQGTVILRFWGHLEPGIFFTDSCTDSCSTTMLYWQLLDGATSRCLFGGTSVSAVLL